MPKDLNGNQDTQDAAAVIEQMDGTPNADTPAPDGNGASNAPLSEAEQILADVRAMSGDEDGGDDDGDEDGNADPNAAADDDDKGGDDLPEARTPREKQIRDAALKKFNDAAELKRQADEAAATLARERAEFEALKGGGASQGGGGKAEGGDAITPAQGSDAATPGKAAELRTALTGLKTELEADWDKASYDSTTEKKLFGMLERVVEGLEATESVVVQERQHREQQAQIEAGQRLGQAVAAASETLKTEHGVEITPMELGGFLERGGLNGYVLLKGLDPEKTQLTGKLMIEAYLTAFPDKAKKAKPGEGESRKPKLPDANRGGNKASETQGMSESELILRDARALERAGK